MSNLFVRKATGMVRSWSVFDAFIYAFFSVNLVTLGFYSFSQMYYFGGGLIPALVVSAAQRGGCSRGSAMHPRRG